MNSHRYAVVTMVAVCSISGTSARADLKMCAIFGDHMVLQQKQPIRIWGWTEPGHDVSVTLAEQNVNSAADDQGRFELSLAPVEAGGPFELRIDADETRTFSDVMVGEVWLCSGQSNMQWAVANSKDADLEGMTAKFPNLRLISLPHVGTQQPQINFEGSWVATTPASVTQFSAVGYHFGRILHQTLDVPVGLIDNAWGGSACEAWIRLDLLEDKPEYAALLSRWKKIEASEPQAMEEFAARLAEWKQTGDGERPEKPRQRLAGQHRPANLYNGMIHPILGYPIKGVIWYQGESNSGRAYQYRSLFPLMIKSWRDHWNQGNFSFYWVQLADFKQEVGEPQPSAWAELREAQTMTMSKLPNTGEAVIIDLGEANDIHPRNKQDVGKRLARWALANDYGIELPHRSPAFKSMETVAGRVRVDFDYVGGGLDTFDVDQLRGFAIAGEDKRFVNAEARFVDKDTIEVWSDEIANPVAVRYAWADNPVCNVRSQNGLPLTPFRSDDWPGVTANSE